MEKYLLKSCLFYGSFLVFPYLIWLICRLYRQPRKTSGYFMLMLCLLFIWTRFIEPKIITVQHTQIDGTGIRADIALISDLHLGIYKDVSFITRVIDKLNRLPVETIFIAGDIIYEADESTLNQGIEALSRLNKPVYAVLGNHDYQTRYPGATEVRAALLKSKVHMIEQKIIDLGSYRIVGLGDHWYGDDTDTFLRQNVSEKPTLVLAHNPDSAIRLASESINLVLSGHTHCGQIRLPLLYRKAIPTAYDFDCGLEEIKKPNHSSLKVFITPGLGEIGLPMRLFIPPQIDVLHLNL